MSIRGCRFILYRVTLSCIVGGLGLLRFLLPLIFLYHKHSVMQHSVRALDLRHFLGSERLLLHSSHILLRNFDVNLVKTVRREATDCMPFLADIHFIEILRQRVFELLLLVFQVLFSLIHLVHFFLNDFSLVDLNGDEAPNLVQTVDLLMLFDCVIVEPQLISQLLWNFLWELGAPGLLGDCLGLDLLAVFNDFAQGCDGPRA